NEFGASMSSSHSHADFWDGTERLATVRDWARSRRVGPWAPLGPALAPTVARIPPTLPIWPYVGPTASPRPVGGPGAPAGPGDGGGGPEGAAGDAGQTDSASVTGPGSGEGINHLFAHYDRNDAKKGGNGTVFDRHEVYFSVPEVDTLASLGARSGSTLLTQLC